MAAANPYFINIELFWPDGTRPNQNQIARVKAFDVYGGVTTEEGQSGYNPNNGGWYPVYMQRISAFYPPREKPTLRFEVFSTAEQKVHTTQLFGDIPCAATVRITIGVGAEIVGGGISAWLVSGTIRHVDATLLTKGSVRVFDVTLGSEALLGSATLGASGTYSIGYATSSFNSNGGAHSQPNLLVRIYDLSNTLIATSTLYAAATNNQVIDVTVPNEPTTDPTTRRRVYGDVVNSLGLPVAGIQVEATYVGWTILGFDERQLGPTAPPTQSDGAGRYEILYDAPTDGAPPAVCARESGRVNLFVRAKEAEGDHKTLYTSPIVYGASEDQRVDLLVNRTASSSASQYQAIDDALSPCLGSTAEGILSTLQQLDTRPEFRSLVADSTGIPEHWLHSYVRARLIAHEINSSTWANQLSREMPADVIFALLQTVDAAALAELINVRPDQFFEKVVAAIHGGIISAKNEASLYPDPSLGNRSILDDWRLILSKLMTDSDAWQSPLLQLVYPDTRVVPTVSNRTEVSFATAATTHNVPMPSGIVAGDLLLVFFANPGGSTVTAPTGWESLWSSTGGNGTNVRFTCLRKVADGTEGGTNVNVQTSEARQGAAQIYRIAKASWSGLETRHAGMRYTSVKGNGTALNPPSLQLSDWDLSPTLWLAVGAHAGAATLGGSPANYTPSPAMRTSVTNCTVLSARREREILAEDPSSFTISTGADWVAATLAVGAGLVSQAQKREQVIAAHFNYPRSFAQALEQLQQSGAITADEAENLTFVFELYERVGQYLPAVQVLYSRKGTRWHSIQDLGKIPLEGSPSQDDWLSYVAAMQNAGNSLPADVPGTNDDEKRRVYAARLHVMFGDEGEQQRFADDVVTNAGSSDPVQLEVGTFLDAHPDFNLEDTNIDRYLTEQAITLSDDATELLKRYQRAYRLTPDFPAVDYLVSVQLDSAVKIARLDEGQFIADHQSGLGGIPAARHVHRTAVKYASEVFFTLVKFHQNLNNVGGIRALPKGLSGVALDPSSCLLDDTAIEEGGNEDTRKYPNWITLFGDLNKCACKDCQTALSPGAYLVDLLEFIEGAPKDALFARRPDLNDLEITCPNTNQVLPYIDLVNEVLEEAVKSSTFSVSLSETTLDQATGDGSESDIVAAMLAVRAEFLACGYVLGEKALLRKSANDAPDATPVVREWGLEDEGYRFAIWGEPTPSGSFWVYPCPQTSPSNDSLEVFPEHFNTGAYKKLSDTVFPFQLPLALGREELEVLLEPKGVAHHEVLEAFRTDGASGALSDASWALSYLKLTDSEAKAILSSATPLYAFWGFAADTDTIARPDKPTLTIQGNWIALMTLVPVFLHRSGLNYGEMLDLLEQDYVQRDVTHPHGLHVAGPDDALPDCNYNAFEIAHLDATALERMSLFLRLWRKLGWSMRDVDCYLTGIEGGFLVPASVPATGGTDASRFLQLAQFKRLVDDLKLEPREAVALFCDIDTRRTSRTPRSLFDSVFLSGSPTQPEYQEFEKVARGGSIQLSLLTGDVDLQASLRAALRLSRDEMDRLWEACVSSSATLTLEILSRMYRIAVLSHALKLTVLEYFDLVDLIGNSPVPATNYSDPAARRAGLLNAHAVLQQFAIARQVPARAAELTYYLTDRKKPTDAFAPSAAMVSSAVAALAAAAAQVAADNAEVEAPSAEILAAALGKVLPADKVARAMAVVEGPTSTDVEFVGRYFAPFLPPGGATAFVVQLMGLTTAADRYQATWALLHAYLVDQARTAAAIELVQQITGVDGSVANELLTQTLHRVASPSDPALDDWKAMLAGGWDGGLSVLVQVAPTAAAPEYVRTGYLLASKSGEHRFVVTYPASATLAATSQLAISLEIDGRPESPEPLSPSIKADHTELEFKPVVLRAGQVYSIEFKYTWNASGTPPVSLSMRVDNADPSPIASPAIVPYDAQAYLKLFKAAQLLKGLELTSDELRYVTAHPEVIDFDKLPLDSSTPIPWSQLSALIVRLSLNRRIQLQSTSLFEFWRTSVDATGTPPRPTDAEVAAATGWGEGDVTGVHELWAATVGTEPVWDAPPFWQMLESCLRVARRLELRISQIYDLLVTTEPSIASASTLRNVMRSKYSLSAWKELFKPLRDVLRQRQRDALVGYLTTRALPVGPGGQDQYFIDANDLFAHYLIDVEMEPDTLISRIKLALNVVQLFIHRVYLGLEGEQLLAELKPKREQWDWMEKYRVWEANRKIFLYPENWIEPELRDDKSEFFEELEDELLQAPVTHEAALVALTSYLEKLSEVSNLEVVGSWLEGSYGDGTNFILHVIGRTRSLTRNYYYRTFEGRQAYDGRWNPWKRIQLEIDADVATPVFANGRLYLFWLKVHTKERPIPADEKEKIDGSNVAKTERFEYQAEIRLMWSEYNEKKNKWSKPRLSKSRAVDYEAPTPQQRELGEEQTPTENYHLSASVESGSISLELYRTEIPTAETAYYSTRHTITVNGRDYIVPRLYENDAGLFPQVLAVFTLWYSGQDTCELSGASPSVWNNLPIGSVLRSNAAVEVDFAIDGYASDGKLKLKGYEPYFEATPDPFRFIATNFGYLANTPPAPFFFETPSKSLFAIDKPEERDANVTTTSVRRALFSSFHHPQMLAFESRFHSLGLEGLMHRLTEALPSVVDQSCDTVVPTCGCGCGSTCDCGTSAGGGCTGNVGGGCTGNSGVGGGCGLNTGAADPTNCYLGYYIAGDDRAWGITQRLFEDEHEPESDSVATPYPLVTVEFHYGTAFGLYNWELFFHVPMLIGKLLGQDLKFEDAMRWYHYVFDPRQSLNDYELTKDWVSELPEGARYWTFLPFFANPDAKDSLNETLGLKETLSEPARASLTALIEEWRREPFNPHLIARQRIVAYQKFVVMKYLDNLIAWADQLFRQDTFETINEATQLYVLADELLGGRPEVVEPLTAVPRMTYRELAAKGIDEFSNAILEVESLLVSNRPYLKTTELPAATPEILSIKTLALRSFYFTIPRNERLDQYWDTVEDRLFKIRNSMNIDGVKRRLALFEPPIDPALLVRAAAAGLDLGAVLSQLNTPLPNYRFQIWIQKATELVNELKSFGAALLSALEKKDAEALQLLRQGHEIRMLELTRKIREQQIREAEENIRALELSRALAEERLAFYSSREKVSILEGAQLGLMLASTVLEGVQAGMHGVSGAMAVIPDSMFGAVGPFPTGIGVVKIGTAASTAASEGADALGVAASVSRNLGAMTGITAGYERRWDDWKLQERLARKEIEQIDQQIVVANIRLDIATKELENHERQIENAQEVLDFLQDKFTNRELYQWMVTKLSTTYNQFYKLAYDTAKTAERTFEFELGLSNSAFIRFGYIDSLRQGLLAGEQLVYDLKRLELAYLERNRRELEIQKPISLAELDGAALQELRERGSCEFELPEVLFDLDFPGQYFRRVKSVRLSIPCVAGPHTSVSAKLTLLRSAYRKQTGLGGEEYPYAGASDDRFVQDPVGIQFIATSRAQGDTGLFELNFRDERYLPFEGAGAISRWRLELPSLTPTTPSTVPEFRQFDYHTISDVVLDLGYTARNGGDKLRSDAQGAIQSALNRIREISTEAPESGLVRVFSLRKEFPDALHSLLTTGTTSITLLPQHFPYMLRYAGVGLEVTENVQLHVIVRGGANPTAMSLGLGTATPISCSSLYGKYGMATFPRPGTQPFMNDWASETWGLSQVGMTANTVDDIVILVSYSVN